MNHKNVSLVTVSIFVIVSAAVALRGANGPTLPSSSNRPNLNAFREFEGRTADVLVVLVEKGMKKML